MMVTAVSALVTMGIMVGVAPGMLPRAAMTGALRCMIAVDMHPGSMIGRVVTIMMWANGDTSGSHFDLRY